LQSSSAERTRESILRAATEEFGQLGLAGARVDQIAKRAGVNKQALYYHYGDKDSLFKAALVAGYEVSVKLENIDWENDPRSPKDLMEYIVRVFFDMVWGNQNYISLITDENRNKGKHLDKDVVRRIRVATAANREAIRTVLRRGQASGEFVADVNPQDLYLLIVGYPIFFFSHTYTLSAILERDITAAGFASAHRDSFVRLILGTLRPSR
jgi:TetR/AcrR family transcriptional regulator